MPPNTPNLPEDQQPGSITPSNTSATSNDPTSQADTPSPTTNSTVLRPINKLLPIVIVLTALALAGLGTSIFFGIQNSKQASEISDLKAKIDSLTKTHLDATVDNPQNPNEQTPDTPAKETLYLEPEGWNVKFAYPDGVTEVIASANDNYDGTLYINSITYDGKVYDVNLFGGTEAYRHYPFFLGVVMRWDENAAHESWKKTPSIYGNTLIFEQDSLEYYYGGGNGYETGDEADYNKAVELADQLLHNITTK